MDDDELIARLVPKRPRKAEPAPPPKLMIVPPPSMEQVLAEPKKLKAALLAHWLGAAFGAAGIALFGWNMSQTFVLWAEKGGALATVLGPVAGTLNFIGLSGLSGLWRLGYRWSVALPLAAWLAFSATDIYGTYRFFSTRFADSDKARIEVGNERARLQGIIGAKFEGPSEAAKQAAQAAVSAAEADKAAECKDIRGQRCNGLVLAEQAIRAKLAAEITAYDTALSAARAKHDAAVDQASAALAVLPVVAPADDVVPWWAVLAVVVALLSIAPGILLWWGLALLRR
jgi:hypothetical protein